MGIIPRTAFFFRVGHCSMPLSSPAHSGCSSSKAFLNAGWSLELLLAAAPIFWVARRFQGVLLHLAGQEPQQGTELHLVGSYELSI